jgi:hypothetical protein
LLKPLDPIQVWQICAWKRVLSLDGFRIFLRPFRRDGSYAVDAAVRRSPDFTVAASRLKGLAAS